MIYLHLAWGFFIANILGFGGGPASIPLVQNQVVTHYHWMTNAQFANVLALGNSLPGPISSNIAAYVGFQTAGWLGVLVALTATIVPGAAALILLHQWLKRYRESVVVKSMTQFVLPVITSMMVMLTVSMASEGISHMGIWQSIVIGLVAWLLIFRLKIHPVFIIIAAFMYGGLIMPHLSI